MKRNKILLDFTSLLDITMIILFWFLINFKNTADTVMAQAAEQVERAESYASEQIEQAEKKESELEESRRKFELEKEEWRKEADAEMEKIRDADEKAADNAQALMDFQNGTVLTMDLDIESQNVWTVKIKYENQLLGEISSESSEDLVEELIEIMESCGLKEDSVIIAILMYDSSDKGSYFKKDLEESIDRVRDVYKQFYCASINIK